MNDSMERTLADWLYEGPESDSLDGLERTLAATHRTRQRPGWTLPGRWLPSHSALGGTSSQHPILVVVSLAALVVSMVSGGLVIGSWQRDDPAPVANGAIVYQQDGDLFIADQLGGPPRLLVAGPETDSDPTFNQQGDRIAFIRETASNATVMAIDPDGSNLGELAVVPGLVGLDWSPDGSTLIAVSFDPRGDWCQLEVVASDGSGSSGIDLGPNGSGCGASFRPDGRRIAFSGEAVYAPPAQAFDAGIYIAEPDGANVRVLSNDPGACCPEWSPDGKRLSFWSEVEGVARIIIADIDADGALTDQRPLDVDATGSALVPTWSPNGSQIAFVLDRDATRQVGLVDPEGSGYRIVGPQWSRQTGLDLAWSPDGATLVISERREDDSDAPAWSIDVATGEQTEIQTPVATWQRLTP